MEGESVSHSLKNYQKAHSLPATGKLNWKSARLINAKRCCHPERSWTVEEHAQRQRSTPYRALTLTSFTQEAKPELAPDISAEGFEPIPARWTRKTLGFSFAGNPPSILGSAAINAVRRAFLLWEEGGVIRFQERQIPDIAEIRILWTFGPGGDPPSEDPFYGPGEKVAVSYFPYPYLGALAGDLHFDANERWSTDDRGINIQTVAIHEIGHCLGLGHCFDSNSVMWPAYQKGISGPTLKDFRALTRKYQGVPD